MDTYLRVRSAALRSVANSSVDSFMARATAKTKPSGMGFRPVSIAERNAALQSRSLATSRSRRCLSSLSFLTAIPNGVKLGMARLPGCESTYQLIGNGAAIQPNRLDILQKSEKYEPLRFLGFCAASLTF